MNFYYNFPAVRGVQAEREYYISMVPLSLLAKIFPSDEEIVSAEFRAQRRINEARIPEIRDYILENRSSYVFSALSASIDGEFTFEGTEHPDLGILHISMDAVMLINDGQHRKAAIQAAIEESPDLGSETISVVFFKDEGLSRSQQMFTDLNKHAVKTSNSLSALYDTRDEIAVVTRKVISKIPFFARYTDKERDILGKNSSKLFTLNTLYKANRKIVKAESCTEKDEAFLYKYWSTLANQIGEWQDVLSRRISKKDLRENYIVTLAVTISAFGRLGHYFYEHENIDLEKSLKNLSQLDWQRSNREWVGRAIRPNGKVQNSEEAALLICSKIKQVLDLPLTKDEEQKEQKLLEISYYGN